MATQTGLIKKVKQKLGSFKLRFENLVLVGRSVPDACTITLNNSCFFRCKMCNFWKEDLNLKKNVYLPFENLKKFIYDLSCMVKKRLAGNIERRFTIVFSGGEPLSYPYIIEIRSYASSLGFRTVIPSNGFLINAKMAKKLHIAGLAEIDLSLDSIDEETHDKIRGIKGAYKGVMRAINYLKNFESPVIGINSVIQNDNYNRIPQLVTWVQKNKSLITVSLNAVMQPNNTEYDKEWYNSIKFGDIWPKDTIKVNLMIDRLIEIKKSNLENQKIGKGYDKLTNPMQQLYSFKSYFSNPSGFIKDGSKCNLGNAIMISQDGNIYLCYHYNRLGNISADNIKKIWNSEEALIMRKEVKKCRTNCHELINCYFEEDSQIA